MSVRIALLDSGVHATHPHITQAVCGGVTITPDGESADFTDMLGHGTAVCALVQAMAPDADIFSVRIFDRRLATTASTVLRGIEWCLRNRIDIINLSLGTTNANHAPAFLQAIRSVQEAGAVLVSAAEVEGTAMLPGSLPGVVGVVEDAACPREDVRVQNLGQLLCRARVRSDRAAPAQQRTARRLGELSSAARYRACPCGRDSERRS